MKKSWNQAVCDDCWKATRDWEPARVPELHRDTEHCSFCGEPTRSGIYVRQDPEQVKFPQWDA